MIQVKFTEAQLSSLAMALQLGRGAIDGLAAEIQGQIAAQRTLAPDTPEPQAAAE
jgi:hypothetical protein